ncbi:hypothetical protein L3X38_000548 [Prunus dulcis]|uniref:Uncharacterized protein n=1 Tax=Prunus dulcis TaxID=3755 RepID=A0AAD4ZJC9_PRUDU|nr:hypothetical protein L3X38_000548 [Prunus dulcis]
MGGKMPKFVSSEEPKLRRKVGPSNLGWPKGKVGPSSSPRFGADVSATLLLADLDSDVDVIYYRDKGSSTSKPKGSRRPQPLKFHRRGSWKISSRCHPRKYPRVAIHSMPKADDEAPEKMEVATKLDHGLSRYFLVKIQNRKVPDKTSYLQLVENFFNEIKPICWIVANCHGKAKLIVRWWFNFELLESYEEEGERELGLGVVDGSGVAERNSTDEEEAKEISALLYYICWDDVVTLTFMGDEELVDSTVKVLLIHECIFDSAKKS